MTSPHISGLVAALLATMVAACGRATQEATRISAQPTTDRRAPEAAIARVGIDSARYPYTAADVHFMSAMIGHHAQAIVMARMAPTHGASFSIQTLAERIINAQQDEITIMQQWLRERGQPVPEPRPGGHGHLMPGMLTEDQLKQLDQARGKDFDRLFLQFMIQHHGGAVSMVKDLFATYAAGQDDTVFKLASDINVDQTTEIDRMQKMLVALLFESPAP